MKDVDIKLIGQRIKEYRNANRMSQKSLGQKVGVKQNTIAAYESGDLCPSVPVLFKLAQQFDTTADYLLGLVDFE